jgi:hypothetical protein
VGGGLEGFRECRAGRKPILRIGRERLREGTRRSGTREPDTGLTPPVVGWSLGPARRQVVIATERALAGQSLE